MADVLDFINPKFNDNAEMIKSAKIISDFAKTSQLTHAEMLEALRLASKKQLTTEDFNGKLIPVKLTREIDRIKLDEVEQAYIQHKQASQELKNARREISQFLNPQPQVSEQDKKQQLKKYILQVFEEFKTTKTVSPNDSFLFEVFAKNQYKDEISDLKHFFIKFDMNIPYYREKWLKSQKIALKEKIQERDQSGKVSEIRKLNKIIENITSQEAILKSVFHRLVLVDFFNKQLTQEELFVNRVKNAFQ